MPATRITVETGEQEEAPTGDAAQLPVRDFWAMTTDYGRPLTRASF